MSIPTKKIGEILLENEAVSKNQLLLAILAQQQVNAKGDKKYRLGEILLFQKFILLEDLHTALRNQRDSTRHEDSDIGWITSTRFKDKK